MVIICILYIHTKNVIHTSASFAKFRRFGLLFLEYGAIFLIFFKSFTIVGIKKDMFS